MSIRAFIGIPLPEWLSADIERLQGQCPVGRPVDPETLHITLAYLGDQPEGALRDLCEDLDRISTGPIKLCLSGLDVFGGTWGSALALDVDPAPELTALQGRIERAVRAAGIDLVRRRFRPHVTFVRMPKSASAIADPQVQSFLSTAGIGFGPKYFTSAGFALYRSILRPDGAVYDVIAAFGDVENLSE